jgi:hypothetical protein
MALGPVAVATGMLEAVWCLTVWARREAMALGAATVVLESAAHRTVCGGEVGRAHPILGRKGGAESAPGVRVGARACGRGGARRPPLALCG